MPPRTAGSSAGGQAGAAWRRAPGAGYVVCGTVRRWPDPRRLPARSRSRAATSPPTLLITGGRVFADATREWVDTSLALADGVIAGWGERDAAEVIDVDGAALTPGLRRRPHAPGVHQAVDRRVRRHRAAGRDDRRRRRPPRARQRAGGPGHPGADGGRGAAAVHLRGLRVELRARLAVRVRRGDARRPRHRRAHHPPRRARRRRGHELPRRDRRRRGDAGPGRGGRGPARRRPQPRRVGARCWTPTSPPGSSQTTRAPAWPRPRRSGARGCGSSCARGRRARTWWSWRRRSSPTAPTRRRSAPTTASPTRCAGSATSTTAPGWPWPAGSRRSRRSCWPAPTRPATTASTRSAASAPATRPTSWPSRRSGPGGLTACGSAGGRS